MQKNRLVYIDNLRLLMIVFAVTLHLAMAYGGLGSWYYKEEGQIGALSLIFYNFVQLFTQSYFMAVMFLITGYFAPASYDKKGFKGFAMDRLARLGKPTILFVFVVSPIIQMFMLDNIDKSIGGYWRYVYSFEFLQRFGPLWFTVTLLAFSLAYAAFRKLSGSFKSASPAERTDERTANGQTSSPVDGLASSPAERTSERTSERTANGTTTKKSEGGFPTMTAILGFILVLCASSFLIRIVYPMGTRLFSMPLNFMPQYALFFAIGIKCKKGKWLDKLTYAWGKPWLVTGLVFGLVAWYVLVFGVEAAGGGFDMVLGGISWQSAAFCVWESIVAVSMAIGMIALFKEKLNKQGKFIKALSEDAFAVFVFHAPILVGFTLLASPIELNLIPKFLALLPICIVSSFLFAHFVIRKIPVLWKLFS